MVSNKMHKIEVMAPLHTEAAALAIVAESLSLPPLEQRQPDLQYLTAIFVSSGMNKNGAVFMGSELVKARGSVSNKAVDIEHSESFIVGQILSSAFLNRDRSLFDVEKAAVEMSSEQQDETELDIGILAVVHSQRFPDIAEEVLNGEWMVSMEAYYRDYDIKVGDSIIPREEAEELGFDRLVGSVVQLKNGDKELGFHLVGRVLRDIHFSGVGLVKNPANPRSVIMETAALNDFIQEEAQNNPKVIDISKVVASSKISNKDAVDAEFITRVIKESIAAALKATSDSSNKENVSVEIAEGISSSRPGTCVSYKRYVYEQPASSLRPEDDTDLSQDPLYIAPGPPDVPGPGSTISKEHYCTLFETECSARPGDATLPTCLRNVFARTVQEEIVSHEDILHEERMQISLASLQSLIDSAKKFI